MAQREDRTKADFSSFELLVLFELNVNEVLNDLHEQGSHSLTLADL